MTVLAHAADYLIFAPVLLAVAGVCVKSVVDRRRDAARAAEDEGF